MQARTTDYKIFSKTISIFLTGMIIFTIVFSFCETITFAFERTIRVGVFNLGNFQYIDTDGIAMGYNIDYLAKVSEKTHWNYEFVECDNWVEGTELLRTGQIDLLAPAQNIPSLSNEFDFTSYSMGLEFAAIYTKSDNTNLIYEDFTTMSGLKYGCAKNSTFANNFITYAEEHNFEPNVTYYENTTEQFDALNNGEVDAIVTNIMFWNENFKTLGRFSPVQVYYIGQKENNDIISELDSALYSIKLDNPNFEQGLTEKYFPQYKNKEFTFYEYEFARNMPEIQIGYASNQEPVSYTDKNGEFAGITCDILDMISKKSGIKFSYIELPDGTINFDFLSQNKIRVVSGVEHNNENIISKGMRMTSPYFSSEMVIVAGENVQFDIDKHYKVAVATGSGTLQKVINDFYPNFETIRCDKVEECFEMVRKGQADVLLQNRYIVEPYLSNPIYEKMKLIPIDSISNNHCLGVLTLKDDNTEIADLLNNDMFFSIINKSIEQIDDNEINKIIIARTSENAYKMTIKDFIIKYKYFIILLLFLLLCMFGILIAWGRTKTRGNKILSVKNKQLKDAVMQADKANRSKGEFLSRMSHEIRTPMNAIVGITAIAKHHKENPNKIDDYLTKIDLSSKVLLNIINNVLDMSALENDKLKVAHDKFDLKEILSSIATIYYGQCKNKKIKFEMLTNDITNEILIGDPLRVEQILLNLISNAYKFTKPGGNIKVVISQSNSGKSEKVKHVYTKFEVIDDGIGMSESMKERLFKPFEQESAETAQEHGGSGLGLSITKNLIDLMHGEIKVESNIGKGTTFTVELPFEFEEDNSAYCDKNFRNVKALIVDDERETCEYTAMILDRIGVDYEIAESGETAIDMVKNNYNNGKGYDICFIDWKMDGISGVDVTREIRKMFNDETIIIIVSAYDLSEVEEEAREAGANMFVSKPLFQSTVFNVLMSLSGGLYTKHTADVKTYRFNGEKILLSEDNTLNSEIAIELLKMVNLNVDLAVNGKQVVEMFNNSKINEYKLILMDIQMPIMNGYEATNKIRTLNREDAKNIPIYAMTANAFSEDVSKSLTAGMDGHIAKPIDTEVLYKTIYNALYKKK